MFKTYSNYDTFTALDANGAIRQGIIPVATAAERNAIPNPHDGMTVYRQDVKREERFDGSNWLSSEAGLILVQPTSLVNATLDASGFIVPNASVQSFSVNGCFTSRYKKYRVDFFSSQATSNGGWWKLRSSGADHSAANYATTQRYVSTALANGGNAAVSSTQWPSTAHSHTAMSGVAYFDNPAQNAIKMFQSEMTNYWSANVGSGTQNGWLAGADSTIFDGFTYSLSSAGSFNTVAPNATRFRIYALA